MGLEALFSSPPSSSSFTPKFRTNISAAKVAPPTSLRFKDLLETYRVNVQRAEGRPLNVPFIAPFTIALSRLTSVENVGVRVELSNGCVGWGEAPILPCVTSEDQAFALEKAGEACELLKKTNGTTLGVVLAQINELLPDMDPFGNNWKGSEHEGSSSQQRDDDFLKSLLEYDGYHTNNYNNYEVGQNHPPRSSHDAPPDSNYMNYNYTYDALGGNDNYLNAQPSNLHQLYFHTCVQCVRW